MESELFVNHLQPLVSVCIPTYNRSKYLKRSLESLVVQEDFLNGNVEIVISDNCSEDDTETVCRGFVRKYPSIIYHRETINSGAGGNTNFKVVMSLASGKLLKLVNDDFVFYSNALEYFCKFEKKYEDTKPQICFTDGAGSSDRENKRLYFDEQVDMDEYLYAVGHYITWIGNFSIWSEDFLKYKDDPAGIEHMFWHVQETLDVLAEKNFGVVDDIVYGNRQKIEGRTISYNPYHNFYENLTATMEPFRERGIISNERFDWVVKDLMVRFFPTIMVLQGYENEILRYTYSGNLKKEVLERCKGKPYYWQVLNNYRKAKFYIIVAPKLKKVIPKFLLNFRRRLMASK